MNKRTLVIIALGYFISVGLSVFVINALSQGKRKQAVAPSTVQEKVTVLIASKDLSTGDRINNDNTAWKTWAKDSVVSGMIIRKGNETAFDATENAKVSRKVASGQPVFDNAFMRKSGILSAALDDGMRAVAIEVSASSLAGGFVTPGDHVDVIMTFAVRPRSGDEANISQMVNRFASQVVLRNVKILAIDQNADKAEKGTRLGRTATLEVDDMGARKLMLASNMGDLSLVLRAMGDDKLSQDDELVTDVTVGQIYREIAKTQTATGSFGNSVRILSPGGVQDLSVRSARNGYSPSVTSNQYPYSEN